MDVLTLWVLVTGALGLDEEGMSTEVITLSLEEVGGKVLAAVAVIETQGGAESRSGNTPLSTLGHDVSPSGLSLVDGILEEVAEQEVLEIGVLAVGLRDVLEEDGPDDATASPHQSDGWLVQFPAILFGGLKLSQES